MTRQQKTRQRASEGPEEAISDAPTQVNPQSAEAIEDACCVLDQIDEIVTEVEETEETDTDPEPAFEPFALAEGSPDPSDEQAFYEWYKRHRDRYTRAYDAWREVHDAWRERNGITSYGCGCRSD